MTHQDFLAAWKAKYPKTDSVYNDGEVAIYAARGSRYMRVTCPFCEKEGKGPDKNHHLGAHFEQEWFKCLRCGTGGRLSFLLGVWKPKPKAAAWTSYKSHPENQKTDPAMLARSKGLEGSRAKAGVCVPISDVPKSHPAWKYLLSEGFRIPEILSLGETYGIHLCLQGRQFTNNALNTTTDRLIFEIREGGTLYGWQARWLPKNWPPSPEDKLIEGQIQKYLISPGMKKTHTLYNWSIAQQWDMWVIVEGIKKVWKTGPFALASFGVSNEVCPPEETSMEAYNQYWSVRLAKGGRPVVLLYDRDAEAIAVKHAKGLQAMGTEALVGKLPESKPNDLDRYMNIEIRQIIKSTAGRLPQPIKT